MSPSSTVPAPNGFSVEPTKPDERKDNPREDSHTLMEVLVSWGLLEESEHQDKTPGRPRRRKYYLNRVLCPYFGVTELHIKDPFYVDDLATFVMSLTRGETPHEIAAAAGDHPTSQGQLF